MDPLGDGEAVHPVAGRQDSQHQQIERALQLIFFVVSHRYLVERPIYQTLCEAINTKRCLVERRAWLSESGQIRGNGIQAKALGGALSSQFRLLAFLATC